MAMDATHGPENSVQPAAPARGGDPGPLDNRVVTLRSAGLFWLVTASASAAPSSVFDTRREARAAARALARRLALHGFATWLETYDRSHNLVSRVRYSSQTTVSDGLRGGGEAEPNRLRSVVS